MSSLSVVISAYNEEKKLEKVLKSVSWADEIIVVDNQSTDKTGQIAKKFGAKVYERKNNKMLNINKNFGFEKATKDWILNLDGDEEVTEELKTEIKEILKVGGNINGYWIPRKNIIFGKWITHGLWWPDKQLRLFRREKGKFPCAHVHEYISVDGETGNVKESLVHHNYETVSQFLHKLDTIYTENEVENIQKSGKKLEWHEAIRMPIRDFVKIYFAQEGYKDGLHGLVLAMLQAFYALVVFAKVWEKEEFRDKNIHLVDIKKELRKAGKEIYYWEMQESFKETKNPLSRLLIKFKRKYVTNR
jgi:glycosyltransferase involved in cell wall biosynthesis